VKTRKFQIPAWLLFGIVSLQAINDLFFSYFWGSSGLRQAVVKRKKHEKRIVFIFGKNS